MSAKRPFWKRRRWKSIGFCLWPQLICIWNWNSKANLTYTAETMPPTESINRKKIQYGRQTAILKMTSLKINRPLPIYISIVPLKFGVDIQSQTKVRVWKPKNPIWPPGGHFENDVAENQYNRLLPMATINMHMKFEIEIPKQTWLMLRKPCRPQTDGRTDKVNHHHIGVIKAIIHYFLFHIWPCTCCTMSELFS